MKRYMPLSIALIMLLSLSVVFAQNQQKKEGKLKGKKIVMIIAERMFEASEFKELKDVFEQEGAKIIVACSTLSEASGSGLYVLTVKPDILITDIETKNFNAIVFIGGIGCAEYFDNPIAHKIAKQALDQGKIIAAICGAPVILANAGLLQGKKATTSRSYNIKQKGAIYTGNPVERDGNIITANGPAASKQFAEKIVAALSE
jgi:protease I